MRKVLLVMAIILLLQPTHAAIIEGKVYSWDTFEPLRNCVVTINTTPMQRFVATNGTYVFEVEPGVYLLEAYYFGDVTLYTNETVVIRDNGTYRIDLLAQPVIREINVTAPEISFEISDSEVGGITKWTPYHYLFGIFILTASGFWIYRTIRHRRSDERSVGTEILPEDLEELIEIIRREGGRITQKELRKLTGYSEAKISLMLADLERRGIIERVKKGRGKIVFLKE